MQLHVHVTALTAFAFRNPRGANSARASRDLLLQRRLKQCLLFIFPAVVYFYCKDYATACACDGVGDEH